MPQPQQVTPITKEEFNKMYWFSPLQMVTLINPQKYDFPFMVELRNFVIKAGRQEKMPGTVANVYLNLMTGIMAQDDDKMTLLSDYTFKGMYYNKLIKDVESLIKENDPLPAYLKDVPEHLKTSVTDETPPWQQPNRIESSVPDTNSDMTNTYDTTPPAKPGSVDGIYRPIQEGTPVVFDEIGKAIPLNTPEGREVEDRRKAQKVKAETKEFELNGLTFKSVTDKDGVTTFFKNDVEIKEADYSKAASMIE